VSTPPSLLLSTKKISKDLSRKKCRREQSKINGEGRGGVAGEY